MDLTDYINTFLAKYLPHIDPYLIEHIGIFQDKPSFVNWLFENDENIQRLPEYLKHCIDKKAICGFIPNIEMLHQELHKEQTGYFLISLSAFLTVDGSDWDNAYDFYYAIKRKQTRSLF